MNILACIKRVPSTGAKITLTADGQHIDTRNLGFTVSPHEECAVEEAVRLVEQRGGSSVVLTLGPESATEQLRYAMSQGVDRAILLQTDDDSDWGPEATAQAITGAIRAQDQPFDVLLFGSESADSGGAQVGIRVARALDLPVVTGIKSLKVADGVATAKREIPGGWEVYQVALPAAFTVKEGINLPRYPSLPGRLKAKRKPIDRSQPQPTPGGLQKITLKNPKESGSQAQILGKGAAAAPKVVELLKELGFF